MKLLISTLALLSFLAAAPAVYAEPDDNHQSFKEKMKGMSPEERAEFRAKKKAEWEAMSKEEKLQKIEEKRAKRLKRMEDKWNGMSDDEKIKHVEERWKRKKGGHHHKGGHHGDDIEPADAGE